MAAVDVGIGHDEHFVVAQFRDVEIVADAASERQHHGRELVVAVDLVNARLLDVQHLAPQRQDGLNVRVAPHLRGTAGGITLDDVDLGLRRVVLAAVDQFARHAVRLQRRLAPHEFAGAARGLARVRRLHRLFEDGLRHSRVLLEELAQLVVHDARHERADLGVAELCLCLALELRLRQLHADDGRQALAQVGTLEVVVFVLQESLFAAVIVERARQGFLEALLVRAALGRLDVVRERVQALGKARVVLHRHLGHGIALLARQVNDLRMQRLKAVLLVDEIDEAPDAALVHHALGLLVSRALVRQRDAHARVQERFLAQAAVQNVVVVLENFEHLGVGLELDRRTVRLACRAQRLQHAVRDAALEALAVLHAVLANSHDQPLRQRVHNARADAVQTARNLVARVLAAELAARVKHREHDRHRRDAQLRLNVHRDAAAVVRHFNDVALTDGHFDVVAAARQRLVDGVVHDLVHQMMQAARSGRADVHARPLANRLQSFQYLDLASAVFVCIVLLCHIVSRLHLVLIFFGDSYFI